MLHTTALTGKAGAWNIVLGKRYRRRATCVLRMYAYRLEPNGRRDSDGHCSNAPCDACSPLSFLPFLEWLIELVACCTQANRRAEGSRWGVLMAADCSRWIVTVGGLGWVGHVHGGSRAEVSPVRRMRRRAASALLRKGADELLEDAEGGVLVPAAWRRWVVTVASSGRLAYLRGGWYADALRSIASAVNAARRCFSACSRA